MHHIVLLPLCVLKLSYRQDCTKTDCECNLDIFTQVIKHSAPLWVTFPSPPLPVVGERVNGGQPVASGHWIPHASHCTTGQLDNWGGALLCYGYGHEVRFAGNARRSKFYALRNFRFRLLLVATQRKATQRTKDNGQRQEAFQK
ncbi:hypothetical protein ACLKA6_004277 [Drosophila palustris]